MSVVTIIAALIFVLVVSVQGEGLPVRSGPVGLVFPIPDGPLSAQQVDEITSTLPDGTSSTETIVSQIYRDSAGRMRKEWRIQVSHGESYGIVDLIDPVARSVAMLVVDSKIAMYFLEPHSAAEPFNIGFPAPGKAMPLEWETTTEGLGTRVIDGVEVEGTRMVRTSADQPPLIAVYEIWRSPSFGVTFVVETSGPDWKHTAKLQKLDRHEPDPALFVIPSDYAIQK
jgi:hypothetical protein